MGAHAKTISLKNAAAKQEYFGESPNMFVGQYGYPRVNVGFLNTENYVDEDAPIQWAQQNKQIPEIIDKRTSLINSTFTSHIKGFSSRLMEMGQDVGMAAKPAEIELSLAKKPSFKTIFNQEAQPHGPRIQLKQARLTNNPNVDTRVEKTVDDTDLKAAGAVSQLYEKGFDEHFLTKLFSVGNLGVKTQRKLVPTKWSITAVDDTVGKSLSHMVRKFPETDCRIHIGGYLGNHYILLFYDDVWSYELFEGYLPRLHSGGAWETDFESFQGRKTYAEETAGGYYAARLAILELLKQRKRQSAVLAIRFITEEYSTPLGVWVVRQAVRKAVESKPIPFPDRAAMESFAKEYSMKRFKYDISNVMQQSKLLQQLSTQAKLRKWF